MNMLMHELKPNATLIASRVNPIVAKKPSPRDLIINNVASKFIASVESTKYLSFTFGIIYFCFLKLLE